MGDPQTTHYELQYYSQDWGTWLLSHIFDDAEKAFAEFNRRNALHPEIPRRIIEVTVNRKQFNED